MGVSLRDARAVPADRRWFADAYVIWVEEMGREAAAAAAALVAVPAASAVPARDEAARWLADVDAEVLAIARDGEAVGFAIVERRRHAAHTASGPALHRLSELWIARGMRGLGIGRAAVPLILDRHDGEWETAALASDAAAVRFWRGVVARYAGGRHTERLQDGELRQRFLARGATRVSSGAR
jgi:predicted acetyltransferase